MHVLLLSGGGLALHDELIIVLTMVAFLLLIKPARFIAHRLRQWYMHRFHKNPHIFMHTEEDASEN